MIDVHVDSSAIEDVLSRLGEVVGSAAVLGIAGRAIIDLIGQGFNDGADPWGQPWKPLSGRSRSGQPLRDTGRLANSIAMQISGDTLEVGTNVCYAPVHQFGAKIIAGPGTGSGMCGYQRKGAKLLAWSAGGAIHYAKQVTIPARPFLPINDSGTLPGTWEDQITADIETMIQKATEV